MRVRRYCCIHYYKISRRIKGMTCGLWGKTIWTVMQRPWIATETSSSSTLRDEEILVCIHFTNFSISKEVLWKWFLFSEVVFPLDKSTEGLVLSFLLASCLFYAWPRLGQEGSTAWDIPREVVSSVNRRDRHAALSVPPDTFLLTLLTLPLSHETFIIM